MASALNQAVNGQLPSGFKSPYSLVTQTGTHDDLLAVVAVLSGKTLLDVFSTAITLGMRRTNYYVDEVLVKKLLFNLSNLTIGPWCEFTTIAALPEVSILMIDYDTETETGRCILAHKVMAAPQQPAFSYIIDVSIISDPKLRVTTSLAHLNLKNAWFMAVHQRTNPAGSKAK